MDCMIMITELLRTYAFFKGLRLGRRSVFIGSAYIKGFITAETAETGKNICRKDLNKVAEVRNIINIRQC